MKPRVYQLGVIKKPQIIIYSDAEWTVLTDPPGLKKSLGGILWQQNSLLLAAALDCQGEGHRETRSHHSQSQDYGCGDCAEGQGSEKDGPCRQQRRVHQGAHQ